MILGDKPLFFEVVLSHYSQLFGCQVGTYPFKYLGIPMHYKKLNNIDWKSIEQRIEKNVVVGKENYFRLAEDWC
jgi:hypothetical protein